MVGARTIGILTFHNCINYGSYWQARALAEGLQGDGRRTFILDHRSRQATWAEWRNAFQPTRPNRTPRADFPLYRQKIRKFLKAFDNLPRSAPFPLDDPSKMAGVDLVVVGGDEVWNFRHPWYAGRPAFFGDGLNTDRIVSYAASFGCHEADILEEPWAGRLRRFAACAVRDDNSQKLLRDALDAEPPLVLDPCLQFADVCRREVDPTPDLAVVYGHGFSQSFVERARAWARGRGVRLVSLGYRNDWADEQWLSAGPDEFAKAMSGARAVVTNFFHGCVFALANRKPFVCALTEYRSQKISALANAVCAADRVANDATPRDRFFSALDQAPGDATWGRIAAMRERSVAYLAHALA